MMLALLAACGKPVSEDVPPLVDLTFVGSTTCENCHQAEYGDWLGSHHQLAMEVATTESVLGDFSGVEFDYFNTTTSFFMRDDAFVVRTENAAGEQQEFEISHTFGVEPLQQYLVDFPDGRKQSLPFTWDTRSKAAGGQRWYHLYADEYIAPDDPLHWTDRFFTWNTACAECHSTDLDVGYDFDTNTFATTFSEISVGCEACHGQGSRHVSQAEAGQFDATQGLVVGLDDRGDAVWIMNPDTGIAERSEPATMQQQVESCGRCHSRRSVLAPEYEYGKPLTDTHMPALLDEHLYYADGRIQDEVYVYGSFLQSKMYAAGVTCSDCHNVHSGALHTGPEPNAICAQCHLPAKFASAEHNATDIGNCVDCHMPATTYMGVDDRRDHSFRRPDAGQQNDHYGMAIAAGRGGQANAVVLAALANNEHPAIARATLLTLLESPLNETAAAQVLENLDDPDPLVRIGALRSLRNQPPDLRMRAGSHLLRDPVRGVRVEAALTYIEYRDLLPAVDARAYAQAANDYRSAMRASMNSPLGALNLAQFELQSGQHELAGRYYEHAIKLDANLAPVQHAYGLYLVRNAQADKALVNLRAAVKLAPENSRFVYVLGVALNSLGQGQEAVQLLGEAHSDFPQDFDIAWALATMLRDHGDAAAALTVAQTMAEQFPGNARIGSFIEALSP